MADLPEPFMWTLSATIKGRQSTYRAFLWFSDPQNSAWESLYTADQLRAYAAAKVAEERARLIREVAALHMAQSVNNQNHPRAWHDGVDAALDAIRATESR